MSDFQYNKDDRYSENAGIVRVETPEGPIGVVGILCHRLLEKGILTKDEHGTLRGVSKAVVDQSIQEWGMCDFCSNSEPKHTILVPDFEMPFPTEVGRQESTGGWAACEDCYADVRANRRADLLRRSIEHVRGGKFSAASIKGLHAKFWSVYDAMTDAAGVGAGMMEFIENTEPVTTWAREHLKGKDKRIEVIKKLTGLTADELDALGRGDMAYKDVVQKLAGWQKTYGLRSKEGARKIAEMLEQPKMLPGVIPHWQMAIDKKFEAVQALKATLEHAQQLVQFSNATDLNDPQAVQAVIQNAQVLTRIKNMDVLEDQKQLRQAEVYSFNADTMHAIITGAKSIPCESLLTSVDIPRITAGWYWFGEPYPNAASPISSDTTAALMWGWFGDGEPVLRFSAWVLGDKPGSEYRGKLRPSTKWYWPVSMSFHEMIEFATKSYREEYGPGGPQEHDPHLIGEEQTIKTVSELSLFFLMSCVWFKQRILIESPGHIERHARKRLQKEHKLAATPTVRVIALRKALREAVDTPDATTTEGTGHKLRWQIVVDGHAKMQPCGPGSKDRKLIWVMPYPKGPADAPFKEKAPKVFAVVR